MFKNFKNTATQLHSYTAKAILFLMLMLSTNFLKAQCSGTVTLENPIYYVSNNERILEQTVFLNLTATNTPFGIPVQSLKITIFAGYIQSLGYQNSANAAENLLTTGAVLIGTPNNYSYQGSQGAAVTFNAQPVLGQNYFYMGQGGSTTGTYKIPLFKWKLRVITPSGCNPLTFIQGGVDGSELISAGIVCQSAGTAIPLSAPFSGNNICAPPDDANITGFVKKPMGTKACNNNSNTAGPVGIPDVQVALSKNGNAQGVNVTNNSGFYSFQNQTTFDNYSLRASKTGNPLCGVSTLDLVLIQKHILATQLLTEWWQLIAADAKYDPTKPGNITTADVLELRKMILATQVNFSSNTSWRFFDEKTVPAPLQEVIKIEPLFKDELANNFIGVKIGDVNGNCAECQGQFAPEIPDFLVRGETPLILPNFSLAQGEETLIPVRIGEDNLGLAYSIGLKLDPQKFEIMEVIPNEEFPSIGSDNFNLERTNIGEVKMLWNLEGENPVALHQGQVLFSLRVRALQGIDFLEGAIQLDNTLMDNTNWTLNNEDAKRVVLDFGASRRGLSKGRVTQTSIFANVSDINATTYLQFATPKRGKAELSVFNTQGKEVYHRDFDENAGNNVLEIDLSASTKSEMYYYLIQTPTEPISGRFIKISY